MFIYLFRHINQQEINENNLSCTGRHHPFLEFGTGSVNKHAKKGAEETVPSTVV